MRGPCAKRRVRCVIQDDLTGEFYEGENDCANAQAVCPRLPGEDYTKCQTICQQSGHAEIEALRKAGSRAQNGTAILHGHYWMCEPCGRALHAAGVKAILIQLAKP